VKDVLRVNQHRYGVVQMSTRWSEPRSRFMATLDRVVIELFKEASF
jgi:hypothetical protein